MQCNKISFISKDEAKSSIRQIEFDKLKYSKKNRSAKAGRKMRVYECKRCGQWHITTTKQKKYFK